MRFAPLPRSGIGTCGESGLRRALAGLSKPASPLGKHTGVVANMRFISGTGSQKSRITPDYKTVSPPNCMIVEWDNMKPVP